MKIIFIFIIFCVSQVFGNNISNSEYYYPNEDSGTLMIKMLFSKLNTILLENNEISTNILEINRRLDNQTESLHNVTHLTEDIASIQKSINESLNQNNIWTLIQRRQDGSVDFFRNWTEYKRGFGTPNNEYFIGLDKLHEITTYGDPQELMIILKDFANQIRYAKYDNFVIGSEMEKYTLKKLGKYTGDAGDSLGRHEGAKFSTNDQDNDPNKFSNCAKQFKGAWWFHEGCYTCHLNGQYLLGQSSQVAGINWYNWHGLNYSLKFVEMKIRPKS